MVKFIDIVFKGLGIVFIISAFAFSAVIIKSCATTITVIDEARTK